MIEIIPATDIIGGQCVRLTQGDYASRKTYYRDPLEAAFRFEEAGIRRLHMVDLDGAKASEPRNLAVLERIAARTSLEVQYGGGIKNREALHSVFDAGARRAICGSVAVRRPDLFAAWLAEFDPGRLILGADVRNGAVAIEGWLESSTLSAPELIGRFIPQGLTQVICTDISRDGMLCGPSAAFYADLQGRFPTVEITVSGGISSMSDIEELDRQGHRRQSPLRRAHHPQRPRAMLAKRIIPCLDIRDGQTVKGINFVGLRQVGDPVELGAKYAAEGADELVYLDISASEEGRRTFTELVARIAARIDIPFTVGGGISSVDDASRLLDAGADKITLNSAAVANPALIDAIAARYGSQFVVAAIDARTVDGRWVVTTHGGRRPTQRELFAWAAEAADRGAGEILFTSMDHDGTKNGYPCDTFARLAELPVPIIASGGAGTADHIADVLTLGRADAALAASIFHYNEIPILVLKRELKKRNINVRL